jgi:hypothetical protein
MLSLALTLAQVIPVIRVGHTCPLGYYTQGNYCVPSSASRPKQAINSAGGVCPLGMYTFSSYCVRTSDDSGGGGVEFL